MKGTPLIMGTGDSVDGRLEDLKDIFMHPEFYKFMEDQERRMWYGDKDPFKPQLLLPPATPLRYIISGKYPWVDGHEISYSIVHHPVFDGPIDRFLTSPHVTVKAVRI